MSRDSFHITIVGGRNNKLLLKEVWKSRELFFMLVWRDFIVRYKQTVLGWVWAFLQPCFQLVVMTVVFSRLLKFSTGDLAYPLFLSAALLPWQFYNSTFSMGADSMAGSGYLLKKIYFPRILVPAAKMMIALIDFFIALLLLILLCVYYRYLPGLSVVYLAALLPALMLFSLGVALIAAALNVRYRDFKHLLPVIIQSHFYLTPVFYPIEIVPSSWRQLLYLNPMTGFVSAVRWMFFGTPFPMWSLIVSLVSSIVLFAIGVICFQKMDSQFCDYL